MSGRDRKHLMRSAPTPWALSAKPGPARTARALPRHGRPCRAKPHHAQRRLVMSSSSRPAGVRAGLAVEMSLPLQLFGSRPVGGLSRVRACVGVGA
jgi:hypothetical protein